jgi:hypothetical protein
MYFPYLRGKQYELIAMRELVERKLVSGNIIPIIEPVKASPYLINFIQTYLKENNNFGIIQNPNYGTFLQEIEQNTMKSYKEKYLSTISSNSCFLPVYILDKNVNRIAPLSIRQESIGICYDKDIVLFIAELSKKYNVGMYMIPDERTFKREIQGNKILMVDNFKKQIKNADYANSVDEFFSEDHLYFKEEGYKGFSDFSIIGNDYSESGFAPYAVVIHMVYFDSSSKLRVHHFVSNSNDDYTDPAGKFKEAVEKLVESSLIDKDTFAYKEFEKYYNNRKYSGLGVIKKLSLMHHIEIISRYLREKNHDIL